MQSEWGLHDRANRSRWHIFSAYRADPSDTPKGAVVVLPEVFGIDPHIKKITESFAALGYVALAPALFDR